MDDGLDCLTCGAPVTRLGELSGVAGVLYRCVEHSRHTFTLWRGNLHQLPPDPIPTGWYPGKPTQ